MRKNEHKAVLLDESVDGLALKKGDTAVDATVGLGGHAKEIARAIGKKGTLLVIDADQASLKLAREALRGTGPKIIYVHGNFRHLKEFVRGARLTDVAGILFDLGWHVGQLAGGKGLSFQTDEPLDMRLDVNAPRTAADIIANWNEDDLATLFKNYGEERFSGRIARNIVEERKRRPIATARALAEIVSSAVPVARRHGRIHPATRIFQALRIAVNDELEALREGLAAAIDVVSAGGRVAVISFHSLEDRIAKRTFRSAEDAGKGVRVTKKPITPTAAEREKNPRARSAKLRIFEKHHGKT